MTGSDLAHGFLARLGCVVMWTAILTVGLSVIVFGPLVPVWALNLLGLDIAYDWRSWLGVVALTVWLAVWS